MSSNSTQLDTWTCCPASRACSPGKSPCLSSLGMNRALRDKTRRGTRGTKGWVTGVQNRAVPPLEVSSHLVGFLLLSAVFSHYLSVFSIFSAPPFSLPLTYTVVACVCMWVCPHVYMCAHMCECVYVWASGYTHVHAQVHACVHICVQTCAYDMWAYARAPCAVLCICICVLVNMYACVWCAHMC